MRSKYIESEFQSKVKEIVTAIQSAIEAKSPKTNPIKVPKTMYATIRAEYMSSKFDYDYNESTETLVVHTKTM